MNCPNCGAATRVIETAHAANNRTRRRHECTGADKHRFTTFEEVHTGKRQASAPKPSNIWTQLNT
jgi:transcriptional regulator NrdR family protein